ncbi:phage antirepressor [Companilactobacillus allii]|uniref:Phage antirepressor n=1 Tax=Companilactobacillus allii TaxID=1847728 RepID=A0A1P8Q495_9LACO|nr:phage antirepressor [Companilactobacillus allii]APX72688.1 phage antirepressor [Companilactobacillus allii]USQ69794.1 phage antirepressor [Companilactobacillus allii]
MDNVEKFSFKGNNVRIIQIENEPCFVGNDVANILGYSRNRKAIQDHVDDEDKCDVPIQDAIGRKQNTTVINESGLYSLILSSKLPNAREFQRWVTSEVLPAIRKHGAYLTDEAIENTLTDPDFIIKLATQLKFEREGRLIAEQRVNELQSKATYYDQVLSNSSLVSITTIAKDYGMGAREMNKLLHGLGVQFKQGKNWFLYAKYQKTGWTHSETFMVTASDGTEHAKVTTKWTQKGRLGLYELLKQKNVIPLIEQNDTALEV